MKRKPYALLGVLAVSAVLTGCEKKEVENVLDSENPTTITLWNYYTGAQQEAFNNLVHEFNETYGKEKGIYVKSSSEGDVNDLEEHVLEAAEKKVGAKEMPNVFMAYSDTAYRVDQMGFVENLAPYFSKEEREEYVEQYLEEGIFSKEELKIFPMAKATEIFALNQTDWEKFADATGVTKEMLATMEGVVDVAKMYYEWTDSLTPQTDDGKAFFGRDSIANYIVCGAAQLGKPFYQKAEDGTVTLHLEEETARKLWDCYYVPYINGYFASAGRFRSDDMKMGTILSFAGSSAGVTFFPEEVILGDDDSYPIETEILAAPQFEGSTGYAVQQGAGMVVTKGSPEEVEASVQFLKWFTDTERNVRFSVESGYLPVKKEANDLDVIEREFDNNTEIIGTIEMAMQTLNENDTVYSVAMENAVDIRNILEYSMSDQATADREAVLQLMENGMMREEAVALYDTEEHFQEWYQVVREELNQCCES